MVGGPDYEEQAVSLENPTAEAVRDAFAALPRRASLTLACRWERRLEVLAALEAGGAFALLIEPLDGFARVRISARKGKSGPCYDTGRRAVYRGTAAAVLDDDKHLIVGEMRVCEKTGGIYSLEPYRGVITVTEAEPALLARLDSDPVPFDCDTFDADSRRLLENVENVQRSTLNVHRSVVYPGPFRALVLADGSVVRRGVASRVPETLASGSGLLRLPLHLAEEAAPCEAYAEAWRTRGPAFILEPLGSAEAKRAPEGEAAGALGHEALEALHRSPAELKRLLARMIEGREPYVVLTGSDPAAPWGCCPNALVGAANRLVEAGALRSYVPPAPPDACGAAFYAFPGELLAGQCGEPPAFRVCEAVRQEAAAALA